VRIGEADLRTKCRKIVESLSRGDRVRVIITFKGREITHPELADTLIDRVKDAVGGSGRLEHDVRRDGKRITFSYIPLQ
jgi:translation initiation factor IF-3